MEYPALIDGEDGAYGVVFPDIPGVAAMGHTIEEAIRNAGDALRDYAIEAEADGEELACLSSLKSVKTAEGSRIVSISLVLHREGVLKTTS